MNECTNKASNFMENKHKSSDNDKKSSQHSSVNFKNEREKTSESGKKSGQNHNRNT
ncbi:con-10 family general stress protein [Candidatus Pantoea carbekii]|uniref:general stress protein n=1 Tax=Candidatus Pantoea carbekii TaxID=1235990 RepID=UPI00061879D0|nr:stress-induced protein [Candidatus Pantoea carbekii]AKC32624.1 putative stress-induced protein [Candidatus Pantoea carbekii]